MTEERKALVKAQEESLKASVLENKAVDAWCDAEIARREAGMVCDEAHFMLCAARKALVAYDTTNPEEATND
jgi:hypothetical protein